MISVRIPQEIRKYKEKLAFGLNARQLIATMLTLVICVPLYIFGKQYLGDDLLSWVIILVALPLLSIGFVRVNGLPAEKFFISLLKFEFLTPRKRKFSSAVAYRDWQVEADLTDAPHTFREKKNLLKMRKQASLERSVLIAEAESLGDYSFDVDSAKLFTVDFGGGSSCGGNGKKPDKGPVKITSRSGLQKRAELIELKMTQRGNYAPTSRELKILKKWKLHQIKARKAEINRKKKIVLQNSTKLSYRRHARSSLPKTTQQTIPYIADYIEGMLEVRPNKYSKMFLISDINYHTAKEQDQVQIFCKLGEFINYFPDDINIQIVVDNRFISSLEQENKIFYQMTGDSLDPHRKEINKVMKQQILAGKNDMAVEKYVVVTIDSDTAIEAILRFHKIQGEVIEGIRKIGADARLLSTSERLSYYHDKFRRGHEGEFVIDFEKIKQRGISSKDYIAPSFFEFDRKHFVIDDDYYRVMFINNLPSGLSDEFFYELYDNDFPVTASLSIQPVAQDKGLKIVKRQLTGIESNKIESEKRAIRAGYSPETIQLSIKDAHAQAEALYEDMRDRNQKMFFVTITFMVHGKTLDELSDNCRILEGKARKYTAQMQVLTIQQEEGMKITLPFGYPPKDVFVDRALTTESTSIFMPFSSRELFQPGGFYYGLNQISRNLVMVNRTAMKTPSGFVLGSSGSGKSFATKREILNVLLNSADTGVLIIDPENEYGDFCRAFKGSVLKISANSDIRINPMDMSSDYGLDEDDGPDTPLAVKKDKALNKKSDYILSIVERMISSGGNSDETSITAQQKTIVDRCVTRCYSKYLAIGEYSDENCVKRGETLCIPFDINNVPTLLDLQAELDKEKPLSEDARKVAEGIEYYTRGSMNVFAHKTNVDVENRLVVFNVRDLGQQLQQVALIIVFDFIWNRMIENRNRGVRTYCYCDEIHVMFRSYYSSEFLKQLYKRGRKYGLCITGLTQNVEDLLRSEQARGMIGNSDFIMMLNQNAEDLKILADMLKISDSQANFVIGADAGSGLLYAEKVIVPFLDRFPAESYLYKLMSTKFGEEMSLEEIEKQITEILACRN